MSDELDVVEMLSRIDEKLKKTNEYFRRQFGATTEEQNRTIRALKDLTPTQLREAARREKERLKLEAKL